MSRKPRSSATCPMGRLIFGESGGYVRIPGDAIGIALAPDGSSYVLSGRDLPAVTRLTSSGQIDHRFGEEGTVLLPTKRLAGMSVAPKSIAVLPDGDIAVAASGIGAKSHTAVFGLRPDGKLDRAFGSHGIAQPPLNGDRDGVNQLAVQRDGRIVLAGYLQDGTQNHLRSEAMTLVRLLPNGSLDRSFGRHGIVVTRVGRRSFASSLAIASGGAILVAGRARARSHHRELLLHYTRAGRLDRAFAHNGISNVPAVSIRGKTTRVLAKSFSPIARCWLSGTTATASSWPTPVAVDLRAPSPLPAVPNRRIEWPWRRSLPSRDVGLSLAGRTSVPMKASDCSACCLGERGLDLTQREQRGAQGQSNTC